MPAIDLPARWPLLHLDRIYISPPGALLDSRTVPEAGTISDHLPVISDTRPRRLAYVNATAG